MSSDDRRIPRLLAGSDRLSRVEKDAILAAVVPGARRRRVRWLWVAAPVLAASAVLVVLAPWRSGTRDDFAARGSDRAIGALGVACANGCQPGAKLLFDVHGTTGYRYLAAFAKRADGTVLWYFPVSDAATSVDLASAPSGVLDQGIVLGAEHAAGHYRVYGVFSQAPLTRAAIRDAFDAEHLTAGVATSVVAADLEVGP